MKVETLKAEEDTCNSVALTSELDIEDLGANLLKFRNVYLTVKSYKFQREGLSQTLLDLEVN